MSPQSRTVAPSPGEGGHPWLGSWKWQHCLVSDEQQRFMQEALAVARTGLEAGEMPIGAVVVLDDQIVAAEHTQELTTGRLLVHADLLALEAADRVISSRRQRSTLYVNLEPCLMCLGAAFTARVGTVVYGLESPSDGGVAAFERWDKERDAAAMPGYVLPQLLGGVLREEAAAMFREYASLAKEGSWAAAWADDLAGLAGR
jgi:tRNA(adenine34) deaminase